MNYPYQDRFQLFLNQQGLAPLTIKTYDAGTVPCQVYTLNNKN